MSADFIESTVLSDDESLTADARRWWDETASEFRSKGATFMRWSHPPDKPNHLYLEGWRDRPADQGPHPWEKSS